MDFGKRIMTVPRANLFTEEGYYVWCGTMFRFNGTYYLIYSRWEKEKGFDAWVSDSKVCLARTDGTEGAFRHVKVLFDYEGNTPGERHVIHNPTAIVSGGRVYLYFMMNYGRGDYWEHRNRQRIGAAYTDNPEGEWTRLPDPVIDITPGGIDSLMTSNPTVAEMPDGGFLMLYKAVSAEGTLPRGGGCDHRRRDGGFSARSLPEGRPTAVCEPRGPVVRGGPLRMVGRGQVLRACQGLSRVFYRCEDSLVGIHRIVRIGRRTGLESGSGASSGVYERTGV